MPYCGPPRIQSRITAWRSERKAARGQLSVGGSERIEARRRHFFIAPSPVACEVVDGRPVGLMDHPRERHRYKHATQDVFRRRFTRRNDPFVGTRRRPRPMTRLRRECESNGDGDKDKDRREGHQAGPVPMPVGGPGFLGVRVVTTGMRPCHGGHSSNTPERARRLPRTSDFWNQPSETLVQESLDTLSGSRRADPRGVWADRTSNARATRVRPRSLPTSA